MMGVDHLPLSSVVSHENRGIANGGEHMVDDEDSCAGFESGD